MNEHDHIAGLLNRILLVLQVAVALAWVLGAPKLLGYFVIFFGSICYLWIIGDP